jgi:hypothetical protein
MAIDQHYWMAMGTSPPHYANANSIAANREGFIRVLRQKLARIMFVKRRVLKQQGTADCGSPTVKHTRYKSLLRRRLTLTREATRRHP